MDRKAYREVGLFSRESINHDNNEIVPRNFYHQLLEKKLDPGRVEDVCLMRGLAQKALKIPSKLNLSIDAVEHYDQATDLTAMEKGRLGGIFQF